MVCTLITLNEILNCNRHNEMEYGMLQWPESNTNHGCYEHFNCNLKFDDLQFTFRMWIAIEDGIGA